MRLLFQTKSNRFTNYGLRNSCACPEMYATPSTRVVHRRVFGEIHISNNIKAVGQSAFVIHYKICRPTRNIHFQGKFRDSWIWTQICLARRLYLENVLKKSKQSWVQFYWLNTFFRLFDVLRRLNQVGANKIVLLTFMWFPRVKLRVISLVLNYVLFETVIFSQKHTFSRKVSRFVDLDANMSCT